MANRHEAYPRPVGEYVIGDKLDAFVSALIHGADWRQASVDELLRSSVLSYREQFGSGRPSTNANYSSLIS